MRNLPNSLSIQSHTNSTKPGSVQSSVLALENTRQLQRAINMKTLDRIQVADTKAARKARTKVLTAMPSHTDLYAERFHIQDTLATEDPSRATLPRHSSLQNALPGSQDRAHGFSRNHEIAKTSDESSSKVLPSFSSFPNPMPLPTRRKTNKKWRALVTRD